MSTIVEKTRRACKNYDLRLKLESSFMVIDAHGSEKKTNYAVGIGRYLTQTVVPRQNIETLLRKEKRGATFVTLEDNLVSNTMLIDTRTIKSEAFFRLTIAARANLLPTPANIQQWYHQQRINCQRYNRDLQLTLAHELNGCIGNMTEMTRRHNKIVDIVRRAIEENMAERLSSKVGDNTGIREEGSSDEARSLRLDLNFVTRTFRSSHKLLIDISCP
jgi:hypothetical protein